MKSLLKRSSDARTRGAQTHITRLVIDVGNYATAWRCAAVDAELHYRLWLSGAAEDRRRAAIDREERAAADYRDAWVACCGCDI